MNASQRVKESKKGKGGNKFRRFDYRGGSGTRGETG